jgi:23S rRNA U2552 (ribose-2'-O)-methylase RlmE/FtsJ
LQDLHEKLARVSKDLAGWGRSTFGQVSLELKKLRGDLDRLQSDPARTGPSLEEAKIMERIVELNHREEIMWQQRSRIRWLSAGDKNTRFFHLCASQRRKKNKITRLCKPDGQFTKDVHELGNLATTFYQDLYRSEGVGGMVVVLNIVPSKVTEEMNSKLIAPIEEKEVKEALFQMFPTKAPGPDGFPAHFFQRHWELCGKEITSVVLRMLRGEDNPAMINDTMIVLIPKVANAEELGQYRPISLCNVIYKIASKVVANRLKVVLPEIIAEEQSAFVPGRLITDNIITTYECLHFMKRKRAQDQRFCALKLDMKKAYDRVEWEYLKAIMIKLGFHRLLVDMVVRLVTTVSFSGLFNGERLDRFIPSRGIRQGDPISPYLFLLAAEGLSCLIKSKIQPSMLKGIKVAPSALMVSHLLFADDSMLFFKADRENAQEALNVLNTYYQASGQQVI